MQPRRSAIASIAIALVLGACSSGGTPSSSSASGAGAPATAFLHIHGLGVDASGTLYVATHGGLIKRTDAGWVYASSDRNDHMGFSLDPASGSMYRSGHPSSGGSLGVQGSSTGESWTELSSVLDPPVDFHAMAVSFADGKTLYGWDSGGRGTFRSTDAGHTWTRIDTAAIGDQIYALAGPYRADEVLAGGAQGMFGSTDGGKTWTAVAGTTGGWVIAIGADPKDPRHMLVSTQRGVKASTDGGATWKDASGGLPSDAQISSIAVSPIDAKTAYAAAGTTVFTTRDGGNTWTTLRSGT